MTDSTVDIAVIGGGPAGLTAATVAAQAGASVVLFERESWPGGRLGLQTQLLQGPRSIYGDINGVDFARSLAEDAAKSGVRIEPNTTVSHIVQASSELVVEFVGDDDKRAVLRFRRVVLATGSWEPPPDFKGSKLSGVMLSGDAQVMLNVNSMLPGNKILMVGSDNAGLLIAQNLHDAGAEIVAVIDESAKLIGRDVNAAPLRDAGVELLTSTRLVKATGSDKVESATVATIDSSGNVVAGSERSFEVDTICLAEPRSPESGALEGLGTVLADEEDLGGRVPAHSRLMEISVPGIYVCGDASGVENGAAAIETGRLAGLYASKSLDYDHPDAQKYFNLARARLGYVRRGRRGLLKRDAKARLARKYDSIAKR